MDAYEEVSGFQGCGEIIIANGKFISDHVDSITAFYSAFSICTVLRRYATSCMERVLGKLGMWPRR